MNRYVRISEKELQELRDQRTEMIAKFAELKADRDEWKAQHENLLVMYRVSQAELTALRASPVPGMREVLDALTELIEARRHRNATPSELNVTRAKANIRYSVAWDKVETALAAMSRVSRLSTGVRVPRPHDAVKMTDDDKAAALKELDLMPKEGLLFVVSSLLSEVIAQPAVMAVFPEHEQNYIKEVKRLFWKKFVFDGDKVSRPSKTEGR